jgi:hypothetical protein
MRQKKPVRRARHAEESRRAQRPPEAAGCGGSTAGQWFEHFGKNCGIWVTSKEGPLPLNFTQVEAGQRMLQQRAPQVHENRL